jgi:hypothetical protein
MGKAAHEDILARFDTQIVNTVVIRVYEPFMTAGRF